MRYFVADSRRTQMTKKLFRTALVELMQEKPFHKITIKEICDRADLNRTTFYLHYEDQNQLLNEIVGLIRCKDQQHWVKTEHAIGAAAAQENQPAQLRRKAA